MSNVREFSVRAVPALFLFAMLVGVPSAARAQDPAGHWDGRVDLPNGGLEVHVDLKRTDDGWAGDIVIPTESVRAMQLAHIEVSGRHVAFAVSGHGGPTFDGTLEKKGARIAGSFSESGFDYPFHLKRAG